MKKQYYSRLEAKQWPHEYFIRLEKEPNEVAKFRKWLRDNMLGGFKADVSFFTTYNLAHCHVEHDDDALLLKMRWSEKLK